jgi:hypothetical protein
MRLYYFTLRQFMLVFVPHHQIGETCKGTAYMTESCRPYPQRSDSIELSYFQPVSPRDEGLVFFETEDIVGVDERSCLRVYLAANLRQGEAVGGRPFPLHMFACVQVAYPTYVCPVYAIWGLEVLGSSFWGQEGLLLLLAYFDLIPSKCVLKDPIANFSRQLKQG